MNKKQLLALFLSNLIPFLVGSGVLPLLPLYAADLGAPPAVAGAYMAFSYLALTAGALAAGWLSDRTGRRRVWLILVSAVGMPMAWSVGRAGNVWALAALTAVLYFLGGAGMTLTGILAGLSAGPDERGRVFGFLGLASGLGALIGLLISGPLVDHGGYSTLFAVLAAIIALWVVAGLLVEDKKSAARGPDVGGAHAAAGKAPLGKPFYLLFAASMASAIANFVCVLGRSLSMDALGFAATAISIAGAIGGAASLPLPLLVGRLSDRVGRVPLIIVCYAAMAAGIALLAVSAPLWQFWLASALFAFGGGISVALGKALATDLLRPESLAQGLALYDTTGWIGAVIGFTATGLAVQRLGLVPTLWGSIALPLIAIVLIWSLQRAKGSALPAQAGKA